MENISVRERIAMFINIHNALSIHTHVVAGLPISLFKSRSTAFFSGIFLFLFLSFFSLFMIFLLNFLWIFLYLVYKYNIGGFTFSLNEIRHGILRGNPKFTLG